MDDVVIETANGDPAEESVKALLEELLATHDLRAWTFTDRVIVENFTIPHSHPVLTIGTQFIVRTPLGVLSTYLHEQLHWHLVQRYDDVAKAIDELRALYPSVPGAAEGGAADEDSTYLHLLVNWLELESLAVVAGREPAELTLRAAARGPVYGWIYKQVFENHDRIADVLRRHRLTDVLDSR